MPETERLLSRQEVAALFGIPTKTLAAWASNGDGPPYFRIGRHARYRHQDIEEWLAARRVDHNGGGSR